MNVYLVHTVAACFNGLKPLTLSRYFPYHQGYRSKILHGARIALCVVYVSQNHQWLLPYTTQTGWLCRHVRKLRWATVSFVMSVRLSVRMEQLRFHGSHCPAVWYWSIFRKSAEKIQVSLKSDKNNGYFTWKPTYIYDHISINSFSVWKCFRQKL